MPITVRARGRRVNLRRASTPLDVEAVGFGLAAVRRELAAPLRPVGRSAASTRGGGRWCSPGSPWRWAPRWSAAGPSSRAGRHLLPLLAAALVSAVEVDAGEARGGGVEGLELKRGVELGPVAIEVGKVAFRAWNQAPGA